MSYKPDNDEVYYCGNCQRQQQVKEGINCKQCGKRTVSWRTNSESASSAMRRWKSLNG